MKRKNCWMIILAMFLFIITSYSALADWTMFQNDLNNTGMFTEEDGTWTATNIYTTTSEGSTFEPLVIDWDNDTVTEVIVADSNTVYVYNFSATTQTLVQEANITLNGTQQNMWSTFQTAGDWKVIGIFGERIYTLDYDGTTIVIDGQFTSSGVSGISCTGSICYYANVDGNITMSNATGIYNYNISNDNLFFFSNSETHSAKYSPIIVDLDGAGDDELVIACDPSDNGKHGICVINLTNMELDTAFSADGMVQFEMSAKNEEPIVTGIAVHDIDGGNPEIVSTYYGRGGSGGAGGYTWDARIKVLNASGATRWGGTYGTQIDSQEVKTAVGSVVFTSNPVIADFTGASSTIDVCVWCEDVQLGSRLEHTFACYDLHNGTQTFNFHYENDGINPDDDVYWRNGYNLISADMDTSALFEIITGVGIFQYDNETEFDLIPFTSDNASTSNTFIGTQDIDDNNNLDIIGQGSGITFAALSTIEDELPELLINLTHAGYGSDYGFTDPICLNTTVTYSAQQCGIPGECNYNDDSTNQRLASSCGLNSSFMDYGTWNAGSPTFQCYYNVTGVYSLTIYLQDEAHPTDFSQFNPTVITVNVIDGVDGLTCNTGSDVGVGEEEPLTADAEAEAAADAVDDSMDSTLDILLGTSTTLKFIVGVAIVIGIILMAAQYTQNGLILAIIGMFGVIIVTLLGLMPIYLLILMILIMLLLVILAKTILNTQSAA